MKKISAPAGKVLFIYLAAMFLVVPQGHACSCVNQGEFLKYAKNKNVMRARVIELGPRLDQDLEMYGDNRVYMDVQVIDVLKGEYEHVAMRLVGDNGAQCLSTVRANYFKRWREYIIAFSNQEKEQRLLGCGEAFVRVEGGRVYGRRIVERTYEPYDYNLTEFIRLISQL